MKVVSENSEAELAQREAMMAVRWALRELTANLMRIVRGAGKPWEVGQQAQGLVNALVAHRDGHLPGSDEITGALSIEEREWAEGVTDAAWAMLEARDTVVRGCLQIAASELLGQNTQLAAGRQEMHEGLRILEETRTRGSEERGQPRIDADLQWKIREARAASKAKPRKKR